MPFEDRIDAGRQLAAALAPLALADPVILALPRGGVPVAFEVARALHAPLDLVIVRKIGAPGQPELASGAVADGPAPQIVVNADVARALGVEEATVSRLAAPELAEIARRRAAYLRGRGQVPLAGRTAVVVDDGIATGATTRAALRAVRAQGPARIVLAVPVAPAEVIAALRSEVDELVVLDCPAPFIAVGSHFRDFGQTSDAEVIRLLDAAAAPGAGPGPA